MLSHLDTSGLSLDNNCEYKNSKLENFSILGYFYSSERILLELEACFKITLPYSLSTILL